MRNIWIFAKKATSLTNMFLQSQDLIQSSVLKTQLISDHIVLYPNFLKDCATWVSSVLHKK